MLLVLTAGVGEAGRVVGQSVLGLSREMASSKVTAHYDHQEGINV